MNKRLEEYKVSKGDKYREIWEEGGARPEIWQGFEDGFNAAIALDLPVKFAKWKAEGGDYNLGILYYSKDTYKMGDKFFTTQELFQYYIDNVYKFEI